MLVSVITPFYEGDKYMDAYIDCMLKNRDALMAAGHELEVILVNDSPWKKLAVPETSLASRFIKVITNRENSGIHFSRVAGLSEAKGEYVMFLDQDDLIADDALAKHLKNVLATGADVSVSNAHLQQSDGSMALWYRTSYHKSLVVDMDTYCNIGIQIISPGQCLIKEAAIPSFWCQNLVKKNGADDYYLWLLMMAAGASFNYLDEPLYIHSYTGGNLSADTTVTDDSVYDFLELLGACDYFPQDKAFALHEMITYKNQFRKSSAFGKISCSLANLGIFLKNLKFKRKTGTKYGFNRG